MKVLRTLTSDLLDHPIRLLLPALGLVPLLFTIIFVGEYGRNYPVNDQWLISLDIAFAAQDGTLTVEAIVQEFFGHRLVLTNALDALLAYTTGWQVIYHLYVIVLVAVVRFVLITMIFRTLQPGLTYAVILPFSLLIFSTYQYLIWLSGIYSMWHFMSLFALAAVWVLVHFPVSWRALWGAVGLGVCAAFSQGSGLVVLPVLLLTLWMYGYRQPKHYAAVLGVLLGVLVLYFTNSDIGVNEGGRSSFSTISVQEPEVFLRFVLAFLGNPFTYNLKTGLPTYIGLLGVIVLIANVAFLWRWNLRRSAAVWMTLAGFSSAVAVMVYLTRYEPSRFVYAVEQRYALPSTHLWLAVVGSMAMVFWHKAGTSYQKVLLWANMFLAVLLGTTYLLATGWNLQAMSNRYGHVLGYPFEKADVQCLQNFLLAREFECLGEFVALDQANEEDIYRLAYADMALFRGQERRLLLPPAYDAADPVVIDTPNPWMNAYLQRWWVAPDASIFHVAPPPKETPLGDAIHYTPGLPDEDTLREAVQGHETIWYVLGGERSEQTEHVFDLLSDAGYSFTVIPLQEENAMTVFRFQRLPPSLEPTAAFGKTFVLHGWTSEGRAAPCELITLGTWWSFDSAPSTNYGLRLMVVDPTGKIYNETASGLTPVPTLLWEAEQLYFDERELPIPCELSPGNYQVAVAVFHPEADQPLPVTSDTLETREGQLRLQDFRVPADE